MQRTLQLSLNDLLIVTREFLNTEVSRSWLDQCLRRHSLANLQTLQPTPEAQPHKAFKAYELGFVHIDVKYLLSIQGEFICFLFVAIHWVFIGLKRDRTACSAKALLKAIIQATPLDPEMPHRQWLGICRPVPGQIQAIDGFHVFDQACAEQSIENRLIRPAITKPRAWSSDLMVISPRS